MKLKIRILKGLENEFNRKGNNTNNEECENVKWNQLGKDGYTNMLPEIEANQFVSKDNF